MKRPAPADLQRWSDEVARDPGALSFLPLAEAYRRQGRREAALRVCLRGLDRHPTHVEAHALLGKLYLEREDHERAADEWATVLRLDPQHFEAHRGLGFADLERGALGGAERHLSRALELKPGDPTVLAALDLLRQRRERQPNGAGPGAAGPRSPSRAGSPGVASATASGGQPLGRPLAPRPVPPYPRRAASPPPRPTAVATEAAGAAEAANAKAVEAPVHDPARLFEPLAGETPFRGALVLDAQGLVLAGALAPDIAARGAGLGAALGPAIEEAVRTAALLDLGRWKGVLLETGEATLHVTALDEDCVVVLVLSRDAPAGWVMRAAQRATQIAKHFLEVTL